MKAVPYPGKFVWATLTGVALFIFLLLALIPLLGVNRVHGRVGGLARNTMSTLVMALEDYRRDFNDFPPDGDPSDNGSEMIWYYLTRVHRVGENRYGPYLKVNDKQLVDSHRITTRKFPSPLGGDYQYIRLLDSDGKCRQFLLVDPGRDLLLGGSLDREKGFVEEDHALAQDNIYSTPQFPMYKQ